MKSLAPVRSAEVLRHFSKNQDIAGAEIGVFEGDMSAELLGQHPKLFLCMVDNKPTIEAVKNTEFAADRRKIINMASFDAALTIEDNTLDFAFIDADHTYRMVVMDINSWWPKVKVGGYLCGHDYKAISFNEVCHAVHEFATKKKLELELGQDKTWFFRKNA